MMLCLQQVQKNSKMYWKSDRNLSLPLLFDRNTEKKLDISEAFITSSLVNYPVWIVRLLKLAEERDLLRYGLSLESYYLFSVTIFDAELINSKELRQV